MLAPYSKDLRWKVIFLAEILDLEIKQVKKEVYAELNSHKLNSESSIGLV